jgi:fermentation-respiration switch protein FrsA (DUF1100 family)
LLSNRLSRFLKRALIALGLAAVTAYAVVVGTLYVNQRDILYRFDPTRHHAGELGLSDFSDVEITTADGERLVALYKPPAPGHATVLYFHGNAGRVPPRIGRMRVLGDHGTGVLFVSYRGYSGSTGTPSEAGLAEDARAAYDWLDRTLGGRPIIAYGESLGSGVAVRLATERKLAGVILDAPYTSIVDVARTSYWWVPVSLLLEDQFRSLDRIARIGAPLLVLHGDRDAIVPFALGEQLYAAAPNPKRFVRIANGSHFRNMESAEDAVHAFIDSVTPARAAN